MQPVTLPLKRTSKWDRISVLATALFLACLFVLGICTLLRGGIAIVLILGLFWLVVSGDLLRMFAEAELSENGIRVLIFGREIWNLPRAEIGSITQTFTEVIKAPPTGTIFVTREDVPWGTLHKWEKDPDSAFLHHKAIVFAEDEETLQLLRAYYPEVPFGEEHHSGFTLHYSANPADGKNTVELGKDGVFVKNKGKDEFFFPAEKIKTIVYHHGSTVWDDNILLSDQAVDELGETPHAAAETLRRGKETLALARCRIAYSPRRWQACRAYYPNAVIVEDRKFLREIP